MLFNINLKYHLFIFLLAALACNNSQVKPEAIRQDQQQLQNTSSTLANLPATYQGSVGCDRCDSISLNFRLNTDLQYNLDVKYIGKKQGMKDSMFSETGEWLINNTDVIELHSSTGNPEFSLFKVISDDELQLLDSTGSVITDGKNYILRRSEG